MKAFIQENKQLLLLCLIVGFVVFTLAVIDTYFVTGVAEGPLSAWNFSVVYNVLAACVIVSLESISKKDWKNAAILSLSMLVINILLRMLNNYWFRDIISGDLGSLGSMDDAKWNLIRYFNLIFDPLLFFLLIRAATMKKKFNFFKLFFSVLLAVQTMTALATVIDFPIKTEEGAFGPYVIQTFPTFKLFWPLVFWLLIYAIDLLAVKDDRSREYFDFQSPLNQSTYLNRAIVLVAIQLVLLIFLWKTLGNKYNLDIDSIYYPLTIWCSILLAGALLYVQSAKKLANTALSPGFLYLFSLPVFNVIPAFSLAKERAISEDEKNSLKQENMLNKLDYCKNCKNKTFNVDKGILCGLTNEKPDFEGTCPDYNPVAELSTSHTNRTPAVLTIGIKIFVIVCLLFLLFQALVYAKNLGRLDIIRLSSIIISWIGQLIILSGLWNQKKWAFYTFLVIYTLNFIALYSMAGYRVAEYLMIIFGFVTYTLVIAVMPAWKYFQPRRS